MKPLHYLNSIDWDIYIEREQEMFLLASAIDCYGKMLRKATGFGFNHQLHKYQGTRGIFFRSKKEMEACNKYFANLIEKKDKRIKEWIVKEAQLHKKLDYFYKLKYPSEIINAFKEVNLYNTIVPYRLLSALRFVKRKDNKIKETLEKTRARSLYPSLLQKLIGPLFEKAARKLKTTKELTSMMTPDELESVLNNKIISIKNLEKRRDGCYFYLLDNQIVFYYNKLKNLENYGTKELDTLKGEIACKGKAIGKAKIVNNVKQMSKFEKGDILFSINTNPILLPLIERAAAIVSDEGGILSHAAIIAREMNIPCVIGTKTGTKSFRDGDLVEVNADEGIVKILK